MRFRRRERIPDLLLVAAAIQDLATAVREHTQMEREAHQGAALAMDQIARVQADQAAAAHRIAGRVE